MSLNRSLCSILDSVVLEVNDAPLLWFMIYCEREFFFLTKNRSPFAPPFCEFPEGLRPRSKKTSNVPDQTRERDPERGGRLECPGVSPSSPLPLLSAPSIPHPSLIPVSNPLSTLIYTSPFLGPLVLLVPTDELLQGAKASPSFPWSPSMRGSQCIVCGAPLLIVDPLHSNTSSFHSVQLAQ